jgi:hypothetical protein
MTYQCARVGLLGLGGAVGHADSALLDGSSSRRKQPRKARIANQRLGQPADIPSPTNTMGMRSSSHSTRRQSTASDAHSSSRPGSPNHSRPGSPNGRQAASAGSLQQTPRLGSPAARTKVQRSLSMASSLATQHTAATLELAHSPSLHSSGVQRDSEAEGDTGRPSTTGDTPCAGGVDGSMTHRSSFSSVSGRSGPAARRAGSPRHRVLALQRSGASSRTGSRPATAPAQAGMLTSSSAAGASAGDGTVQVWQADDDYSFLNDPSLTPEEQEIMLQHMQGGRKKGVLTGLGYTHVPGSGVFSPAVQEALAKVAELKAEHQQVGGGGREQGLGWLWGSRWPVGPDDGVRAVLVLCCTAQDTVCSAAPRRQAMGRLRCCGGSCAAAVCTHTQARACVAGLATAAGVSSNQSVHLTDNGHEPCYLLML